MSNATANKMEGIKIEIHQMTNYGPALLNRDDNGNVKEINVGGVRRARISSQCMKYAIRNSAGSDDLHTRRIFEIVESELKDITNADGVQVYSDDYIAEAINLLAESGLFTTPSGDKNKDKKKTTSQVLTYSKENDILAIVDFVVKTYPAEKDLEKALEILTKDKKKVAAIEQFKKQAENRKVGRDVAMFGRMSTDAICTSIESSVCMNHAYGINSLSGDVDFFTAVEDYVLSGDDPGSAMLDNTDIDSSCFYKYACIDMNTLINNLFIGVDKDNEEDREKVYKQAEDAVVTLFGKLLHVAPVAKQHSNASCPNPVAVYVRITKNGYPCTMDEVFEKVISKKVNKSVAQQGVEKMVEFILDDTFECDSKVAEFMIAGKTVQESIPDTIEKVTEKEAKAIIRKVLND